MDTLEKIFSSKTRAEIIRILFGIDQPEVHLREIQRKSGLAIETVRKEAMKLEDLELIIKRQDGNRLYFKANTQHPLFNELAQLVVKTSGIKDIIHRSLQKDDIDFAFIFGSIAEGTANSESDIDLFIIGDTSLRKVTVYLKEPAKILGREINPHVISSGVLKERFNAGDHFITRMFDLTKIMIIGSEDEFAGLVK